MSLSLLAGSAGFFALSGVARGRFGTGMALMAGLLGLLGVGVAMGAPSAPALDLPWSVPGGRFTVGLDALSLGFLIPVLVIPPLGALYGHAYFPPDHPTYRRTRLAYGLLPASMILLLVARHALLLLVAWEGMALSAFFLLAADDHDPEVSGSAWVYLVATHMGTLCLIAAFAIVARHTGTLALEPMSGLPSTPLRWSALLFLVGFGMKAGIMPLHFWLPGAHANAPSHVSAVMSGVVLNMGLYGLARMASLLTGIPGGLGGILLTLGAVSALLGAAFSLVQSDLKRLLAYSSVDNMSIAVMGLGLALIGRAAGRDDLLALGVAGMVWHAWNHSLFKSLLFFSAGAVVHATGSRRMDLLGGLTRRMPATAAATFVGLLALSGLPPLNGFFGELVLYVGLSRSVAGLGWPALATPALAMTGALALAASVKVYGGVFLGVPRRPNEAHDPPLPMGATLGILAALCVLMVVAVVPVAMALDAIVASFAGRRLSPVTTFVPLGVVAWTVALAVVLAAAILHWARRRSLRRGALLWTTTWACGYPHPTPRMQYTPTSFAAPAMGPFRGALISREFGPSVRGLFPARGSFFTVVPDLVLDRAAVPLIRLLERAVTWLRLTQQGNVHAYVLYILVAILGLLWVG